MEPQICSHRVKVYTPSEHHCRVVRAHIGPPSTGDGPNGLPQESVRRPCAESKTHHVHLEELEGGGGLSPPTQQQTIAASRLTLINLLKVISEPVSDLRK